MFIFLKLFRKNAFPGELAWTPNNALAIFQKILDVTTSYLL